MKKTILFIIVASIFLCLVPQNAEARKQKKGVSDSLSVNAFPDSIAKERLTFLKDSIAAGGDSLAIPLPDSLDLVPTFSDEYLDTVKMKKAKAINDYTMIGVQYGVSLSQMRFNPTKRQGMLMTP